jgi:hypothetical protein
MSEEDKELYFQDFIRLPAEKWREWLVHFLDRANAVEFAWQGRGDFAPSLEPFQSDLRNRYSSRMRWGAKQLQTTMFTRFTLTDALREFLLARSGLGEWRGEFPEDPTLLADDDVLMWTISHENLAFARMTAEHAAAWNAKGFSLEKAQDGA